MGAISKKEDEWQAKATAAAIAGANKIVRANNSVANTRAGDLSDGQWGWIVAAVIFGWIEVRVQQAISEGLDQEQTVRVTGLSPSPCDAAVITSILPALADTAGVDWSLPLSAWSKDGMINFLLLAWKLINQAEAARDHGPGTILKKAEVARDGEFNDPIPFVPESLC